VFQDFNLLSALTVAKNVELACNLAGVTGRAAHQRGRVLLGRVGLGHRLGFRPEQLSGGEKQRVAVARALANDPPLVLADEPSANLDSAIGRQVARLLRQLATEDGRAVVIVSHDARLKEIADRVLWLEDGTFRELATMATDPICGMAVPSTTTRTCRSTVLSGGFAPPAAGRSSPPSPAASQVGEGLPGEQPGTANPARSGATTRHQLGKEGPDPTGVYSRGVWHREESRMQGYTADKDKLQARLRRVEGQVRGLQRMVDEDAYCIDVLTQISAVNAALRGVAVLLLDDHLRHCVRDAASDDARSDLIVTEATEAIERLLKS
jgi:DNA-binding FrmR family transcriptional regulator